MYMDFIAIDFETANNRRDSICSIGLVKIKDKNVVEKIHTYINPEQPFDSYNIMIHGIDEKKVEDAPTFKEYWPTLKRHIENELIVAHFSSFDMSVLRSSLNSIDEPYPIFQYTCSYQISQKVWPEFINYKLTTLADYLSIEFTHHDALEDAYACSEVINKALELSECNSITELMKKFNMKLGKHDGISYTPSGNKKIKNDLSLINTTNQEFETGHPFYEASVVFTGTLNSMVRKEAAQKVVDRGGTCSNSVNKNTSYLVIGDYDLTRFSEGFKSSKIVKAETLLLKGQRIEIISENEFVRMI